MPTPTYIPMANITLTGSASSVTFSSISQAYRDLVVIINGKGTANLNFDLRLNGDSAANYSQVNMRGNGSTAASSTSTGAGAPLTVVAYMSATTPCNYVANVLDYSATDKHKSILSRGDNPDVATNAVATRWANTAAVTSLSLNVISDSFAAGSTFSLFGIAS